MKRKILVFFANALIITGQAQIRGKVIAVADGDTFTILTAANEQIKIRLHGIDCPEKKQDYGNQAKQFTTSMIFNEFVEAYPTDTDRYSRVVAIVYTIDGKNVNEELLSVGLAWHYTKYDKNYAWDSLERQARINEVGLWHQHSRVPPWDFRKKPNLKTPQKHDDIQNKVDGR